MAEEIQSDPAKSPVIVPSEEEEIIAGSEKSEAYDMQAPTATEIEQNDNRISEVSEDKSEEVSSSTAAEEELITIAESRKRKPPQQKTETGAKQIVNIAPATVNLPESDILDSGTNVEEIKILERIYQQRIAATSKWISGKSNDKHTVQLMVLTSEQAEGNLKKRFEQEEYRAVADDLYVIKNADDSSVFVYYGEYADPDSAMRARNTLPIFLRKNNPYVISVKSAVKKATSP